MSEFELDEKIYIKKTDHCDTRALKPGQKVSEDSVLTDTFSHKEAVALAMDYFARMAQAQAKSHDWSKVGSPEHHDKNYLKWFTEALNDRAFGSDDGKDPSTWWGYHVANERHHLNNAVPSDVNLIDVMEMLCDCVCAGMARTGNVYPIEIKPEVLKSAVDNTVGILKNRLVVYESPETQEQLAFNRRHDQSKSYEVYSLEGGKHSHIAYCESYEAAHLIARLFAQNDPLRDAYYITSGNILPDDMVIGGGWYDCLQRNEKGEVVECGLS